METKFKNKYNFEIIDENRNNMPKDILVTVSRKDNCPLVETPILKESRKEENVNKPPTLKVVVERIEEPNKNVKSSKKEIENEENPKKDILMSKPYPEILKKKILLNINLFKLYIDNFYYEDFENSRKCLYFLSSFPILTYILLTFKFSEHPLRRSIIVFNTLFSSGLFIYFYQTDLTECSKRNTDLGLKVKEE
jgi:hypothetical protein